MYDFEGKYIRNIFCDNIFYLFPVSYFLSFNHIFDKGLSFDK